MALKKFLLTLVTLSTVANAVPLTPEQKACTFKKTIVIGASISANTAMNIPMYYTGIQALALIRGVFSIGYFGPGPHHQLLSDYANQGLFAKIYRNYSVMFTNEPEYWGSAQIFKLIKGSERPAFDRSSLIIGVDAFYWDAIQENCGEHPRSAENAIIQLVNEAREKKIKLILGNVPDEEPKSVIIDSERLGIPGLWYKPDVTCALSINATLERVCLPENGCYVVDLYSMAARLNEGKKLSLKDGSAWGLYRLRPDGVHLSFKGSRYVAEQIIDALEAHPPVCQ